MINPDELFEVLSHWKQARETRLNEVEIDENLRCVIDIVALLSKHGIETPKELRQDKLPRMR